MASKGTNYRGGRGLDLTNAFFRNSMDDLFRGRRRYNPGGELNPMATWSSDNCRICYGVVKKLCEKFGFIQTDSTLPSTFAHTESIFFHFDVASASEIKVGDRVGFTLREGSEERPAAQSVWCVKSHKKVSNKRLLGTITRFSPSGGFLSVVDGDDGQPIQDVYFSFARLRCAELELVEGDILEFTLEPCKKDFAQWFATSICLREFRPRKEELVVRYIKKTTKNIISSIENGNEVILDLLNCKAFWQLCGQMKSMSVETVQAMVELILLLKEKARLLQHAFKDVLRTLLNSELFKSKKGPMSAFAVMMWESENKRERERFQEFLTMTVELLPEKAFVITPFIKPVLSMDPLKPDTFLFNIVKRLSELNCEDIDDLEWNRVPLVPSTKELQECPLIESVLFPVRKRGSYENPEIYMDTYFRLLRADCFDSLRSGIQDFLRGELKPSDMNMYMAVSLKGISVGGKQVPLSFALKVTPDREIRNWELCSNLMYGNLVCLSPSGTFNDAIWATVVHRDVEQLQKDQVIWVRLCEDVNVHGEAHCISVLQETSGKVIMAESPTYYNAYRPVLKALQNMNPEDLAFKEELVSNQGPQPLSEEEVSNSTWDRIKTFVCEELQEPDEQSDSTLNIMYINRILKRVLLESTSDTASTRLRKKYLMAKLQEPKWLSDIKSSTRYMSWLEEILMQNCNGSEVQSESAPESKGLDVTCDLDESQLEAFHSCLDKRISIVQGPPGTGKTYVGIRLVEYFLKRDEQCRHTPILVLTYKNHALDEFLKSIIDITDGVIRVGQGSKGSDLANYNLQFRKQQGRGCTFSQRMDLLDEASLVKEELTKNVDLLKSLCQCTINTMISALSPVQLKLFLQNCPWQKVNKSQSNGNKWSKRYVMQLWQDKHGDFEIKDSTEEVKVKCLGDKLVNALNDAIAYWLPPADTFKSYSVIEDRASKMMYSLIVHERNKKQKEKKSSEDAEDDDVSDEEEDDIEVKQKEAERLSAAYHPTGQNMEMNVKIKKDPYHGYFSRTMHRIKDVPFNVVLGVDDLWSKDEHERAILAQVMTYHYKAKVEMEVQDNIDRYKTLMASIEELHNQEKLDILRNAKVVGMTITGASIHQDLLNAVQPSIILVEEAAEVLEPQLIGLLGTWVKRLILIGDHMQLKPQVESFRLVREYHFDTSMMERLISNGYSHATLKMQNRMLPEMATLLEDIYPELESNLERVNRNSPPDFAPVIYFWDHNDLEYSSGRSYSNKREAGRVIALASLLIIQKYPPPKITILCAYQGQTRLLRRMYRDRFPASEVLRKDGEGTKRDTSNDAVIQTIDNYQGDENDIVIVSLVRCNNEGNIGFLRSQNRRCVAQSRAKCGMYFIGSASTLRGSRNGIWNSLLDTLQERKMVGTAFPIHCPEHPELSVISATNKYDIPELSICEIPCASVMECQLHKCPRSCQPPHDHSQAHCKQTVDFLFSCGHPGKRRCRVPQESLYCRKPCEEKLSCGHICQKHCQPEHIHSLAYCEIMVDFIPKCGHPGKKMCGQNQMTVKCFENCSMLMDDCGHPCPEKCSPSHSHLQFCCRKKVLFKFSSCGHDGTKQCGQSESMVLCDEIVPFTFSSCKHQGERRCSQNPSEVHCKEQCSRIMNCGHMCMGKCGDSCNPERCNACKKIRELEAKKRREAEEKVRKAAREEAREELIRLSRQANVQFSVDELRPNGDTASEYWDVEDRVKKYVQPGHNWFPNIVKIEKVTNIKLYRNWLRAKSELVDPTRSELKFHGTTNDSIDNIIKHGFKRPRKPGMFGIGIYFATDSSKSAQERYTRGSNKILLCDVLVGRSLTLDSARESLHLQSVRKDGYDSVYARRSTRNSGGVRYDEYVIYNPSQSFPKYVIHFSKCSLQDTKLELDQLERNAIQSGQLERHSMKPKRAVNEDPLDMHYRLAESQFLRLSKRMSGARTITSIEYCINPKLVERFRRKQAEFKHKYAGKPEADQILAFHGTPVDRIEAIIQENFKMEKCVRGAYGTGIYFSEFPDISEGYAGSSRKLLLCNVLPGRSFTCSHDVVVSNQKLRADYDSHIVRAHPDGRGEMVVIDNPDQILPSYIITYA